MKRLVRKATQLNKDKYFTNENNYFDCQDAINDIVCEKFNDSDDARCYIKIGNSIETYNDELITDSNREEIYETINGTFEQDSNYQVWTEYLGAKIGILTTLEECIDEPVLTEIKSAFEKELGSSNYNWNEKFLIDITISPDKDIEIDYFNAVISSSPKEEEKFDAFLNSVAKKVQETIDKYLG
jgi:hypothetical protein